MIFFFLTKLDHKHGLHKQEGIHQRYVNPEVLVLYTVSLVKSLHRLIMCEEPRHLSAVQSVLGKGDWALPQLDWFTENVWQISDKCGPVVSWALGDTDIHLHPFLLRTETLKRGAWGWPILLITWSRCRGGWSTLQSSWPSPAQQQHLYGCQTYAGRICWLRVAAWVRSATGSSWTGPVAGRCYLLRLPHPCRAGHRGLPCIHRCESWPGRRASWSDRSSCLSLAMA